MKDQEPVKILYITQEINPYIKETEIADICRQFPQYTIDKGCEMFGVTLKKLDECN